MNLSVRFRLAQRPPAVAPDAHHRETDQLDRLVLEGISVGFRVKHVEGRPQLVDDPVRPACLDVDREGPRLSDVAGIDPPAELPVAPRDAVPLEAGGGRSVGDTHNPTSITPNTIEAGAWQVSANSMSFGPELKDLVLRKVGSLDGNAFQRAMKRDHPLAMEYIARLLRRTVKHNGPVKRHEIDEWLRRDAVEEFQTLLGTAPAMTMALSLEGMAAGIPSVTAEPAGAGMHGFDTNTQADGDYIQGSLRSGI